MRTSLLFTFFLNNIQPIFDTDSVTGTNSSLLVPYDNVVRRHFVTGVDIMNRHVTMFPFALIIYAIYGCISDQICHC